MKGFYPNINITISSVTVLFNTKYAKKINDTMCHLDGQHDHY